MSHASQSSPAPSLLASPPPPSAPPPRSCDTFVALPPATPNNTIVFGKNSDRPDDEAQHVVYYPPATHPPGTTLPCTHITIPQAPTTRGVLLSKPAWMWGAEMAANDAGVVIGNEAVWTTEPDGPPALLGMDLVRLAAERCGTAQEAVDTIVQLLERHGQGGGCEEGSDWCYHNSYLIADRREAWVVETAGKWWVAQRVTSGVRNISNCLSIRDDYDRCCDGLEEHARAAGRWRGDGRVDWADAFSSGGAPPRGKKSPGREAEGLRLLEAAAAGKGGVGAAEMMAILRDRRSGICMCGGGFRSNGAQVSILASNVAAAAEDVHFFIGTPDPSRSCFKPLSFSLLDNLEGGVPLEAINEGAAALYAAGDRRGGGAARAELMRVLEAEGLDAAAAGRVGGAATWMELMRREVGGYT